MRNIPISVILTFPISNYVDPVTRGPALTIVNGIFIGIVLAALGLRLYTRLFIKRWFGIDDLFIVIATIFAVGLTIVVVLADQKYMWDRHVWDIPLPSFPAAGQIAMAAKILFTLSSFFTRQSLLCFYYRLVSDSGMYKFRVAIHLSTVFNIGVVITFVFLSIFLCIPIKAYWIYPPMGRCLDEGKVMLAGGIIACFADLLITTLPIPMVMKLKMRLRQRLIVAFLMGLGFIVTIAGIVRTYFIWMAFMSSYDETWYSYPLWIAAAVEIDLAIITACAPSLKPLIAVYAGPLLTTVSKRSRTGRHDPSYSGSHGPHSSALAGASTSSGKHSSAIALQALAETASESSETSAARANSTSAARAESAPHLLDSRDEKLRRTHDAPAPLAVTVRRSFDVSQSDGPFEIAASDGPFGPPPPHLPAAAHRTASPRGPPPVAPRSLEPRAAAAGPRARDWGWPLREERRARDTSTGSGGQGAVERDDAWVEERRDGARTARLAPRGRGVRTVWLDHSSGESE